jgi:hypothetical protein
MGNTLRGWPGPKEITRQNKLATEALRLADATGYSMADLLHMVRGKTETGQASTAEEGLRQLYEAFNIPAPGDGQQYLIIKDGALIAPGEVHEE